MFRVEGVKYVSFGLKNTHNCIHQEIRGSQSYRKSCRILELNYILFRFLLQSIYCDVIVENRLHSIFFLGKKNIMEDHLVYRVVETSNLCKKMCFEPSCQLHLQQRQRQRGRQRERQRERQSERQRL